MLAILLAGGYAKRLWPLTLTTPKPLLTLAGKATIDYVLEAINSLGPKISKIIVLTNEKFKQHFQAWANSKESTIIHIASDGSRREADKPGAIGALAAIANTLTEDTLVIAADNLFTETLQGFINYFEQKQAPVVALYHASHPDQVARGSSVIIDSFGRITHFTEKPEKSRSDLVGAAIYAFPPTIKHRLQKYVNSRLPTDEPGRLIEWLHTKEAVYGYVLKETVWDIGTIQAYKAIDRRFSRKKQSARPKQLGSHQQSA